MCPLLERSRDLLDERVGGRFDRHLRNAITGADERPPRQDPSCREPGGGAGRLSGHGALDVSRDDWLGVSRGLGRRGGRVSRLPGAGARHPRAGPDPTGVRRRGRDRVEGGEEPLDGAPGDRQLHGEPAPSDRPRLADDLRRGGLFRQAQGAQARDSAPGRRARGRGSRPAAPDGVFRLDLGQGEPLPGRFRGSRNDLRRLSRDSFPDAAARGRRGSGARQASGGDPLGALFLGSSPLGSGRAPSPGRGGRHLFRRGAVLDLDARDRDIARDVAVRLHSVGRAVSLGVSREDLRVRLGQARDPRARRPGEHGVLEHQPVGDSLGVASGHLLLEPRLDRAAPL